MQDKALISSSSNEVAKPFLPRFLFSHYGTNNLVLPYPGYFPTIFPGKVGNKRTSKIGTKED